MTARDAIFTPGDYFRESRVADVFANAARPLELDLGCGDGSFLTAMALRYPERNFLGVERLLGRVDKTARRIAEQGLSNARVLRLETAYTLAWLLPPRCATRVHLLCPDPWPKKSHRPRRIINQQEFIEGLERVLVPGGELLLKSDDRDFFENAVEVMAERTPFQRLDWPEEAFFYPRTAFEDQWLELGKALHRARWQFKD